MDQPTALQKQPNPYSKYPSQTFGRPTKYSTALAEHICHLIANKRMTVSKICAMDGMPTPQTIANWLNEHLDFFDAYMRARARWIDGLVEETVEIADTREGDWHNIACKNGEVKTVFNREHVQRSDLRVRTRQWLAERIMPRVYGAKSQVEVTGSQIHIISLSPEDRARIVEGRVIEAKVEDKEE